MNSRLPGARPDPALAARLAQAFNAGLERHQAGQLAQAEGIYRQILAADPGHVETVHQMGILAYQVGKLDLATGFFADAVRLNGKVAVFHYHLGLALQDQGRLEEACAAYRRALAVQPNYPRAHNNIGNAFQTQGQLDKAAAAYARAIALKPDYPEAHYNLGMTMQAMGKLDEAARSYAKAVALNPNYADAHNNIGNIHSARHEPVQAEASYRRALTLQPNLMVAHNNLGSALLTQGRAGEAAASHRRALALAPNDAATHFNLANALSAEGKLEAAAAAYRRTIELDPTYAGAYSNLGNLLRDQGKLAESEAAFRQAIAVRPDMAEAHMNLGATLQLGRAEDAHPCFERALALRPDYADARSGLLLNLHYRSGLAPAAVFAEHRRWDEAHGGGPDWTPAPHANARDPERRLRVGYVSADFRSHSVAYFLEPLLAAHDRAAVEVFAYAQVSNPDGMTARLKALSDHWRSIVGVSDEALAAQVRADGIDILVDVAGHTAGNRLLMFARKPAPVQVTWLGYPDTTGLGTIDYRLVDAITDPPGEADAFASEKLVRLEDGFLCYSAPADAPEVAAPPSAASGFITFGSFNNPAKLSDETVQTWAALLTRVPTARLMLKGKPFADAGARSRLEARFAAHGIEADRLSLRAVIPETSHHLGAYGQIDIALDPFPYNGTTTTCEAMWMGVPVVTLTGDRHAGRVGASLLARVGLEALIASDAAAYIEIAAALAEDSARLASLRQSLRPRLQASPLTDAPAFARKVEAAFREMWQAWAEGGV